MFSWSSNRTVSEFPTVRNMKKSDGVISDTYGGAID